MQRFVVVVVVVGVGDGDGVVVVVVVVVVILPKNNNCWYLNLSSTTFRNP